MQCPRCGSENVQVQILTEVREKRKKGLLYWLFIGWWWEPLMWILFGVFKLMHALFSRKTRIVTTQRKVATCQRCGNSWALK